MESELIFSYEIRTYRRAKKARHPVKGSGQLYRRGAVLFSAAAYQVALVLEAVNGARLVALVAVALRIGRRWVAGRKKDGDGDYPSREHETLS